MPNPACLHCTAAHNGINGRYCNWHRRYVEYDNQPMCKTPKTAQQ